MTTSFSVAVPQKPPCDALLERTHGSKELAADIDVFNRMRDDNPDPNLKWLTDWIDPVLQRQRMERARTLQNKLINNGVVDTDAAPRESTEGKCKTRGR